MRMSLKVLAVLWVLLLAGIAVLLFNAYSRLKPETIVSLLSEQVEKNYPGARLTVGNISYRFSLDFGLNLKDVYLRRNDKLLASVGKAELKVPWWLLLFDNGNAQINLTDMDVFVDHTDTQEPESAVPALVQKTLKVEVPVYISDAKYTLRAKNISIRDLHSSRRYFVVSKLLVREFHYGRNSAFEMNIPVSIKNGESQYAADLWLFGDITPDASEWVMNYRGEFRTRESSEKFKIEDLIFNGKASFSPKALGITSEINLLLEKNPVGRGAFIASQDKMTVDFQLTQFPMEYFQFVYDEIRNPYLPMLSGTGQGDIKYEKKFGNAQSAVTGKLSFPGNFYLTDKDIIPGNWKLSFFDSRWEASFISPKGEASFFRRSFMDMKKNKVTQYNEELGFSGLDLTVTLAPVESVAKFASAQFAQYFSTAISYSKCLLHDQVLDGSFRYGYTPEQKFYTGELSGGKTSFKVSYAHKDQNAFDLKFQAFPWDQRMTFFAPLFMAETGLINGTLEGRWSDSWQTGQWLAQLSFSARNAGGKFVDFFNQTGSLFGVNAYETEKKSLTASLKNGIIAINSLLLEAPLSVKITGSLSTKQKSILNLSYLQNKKLKPVKKEVVEPYWIAKEEP